jgi:hypothetical protein
MEVRDRGRAYEPLDLSALCDAGLEVLGSSRRPAIGERSFHGIPFRIGDPDRAGAPCFLLLEPGGPGITVPVDRTADRLIVAHRWLRDGSPEVDPPPGAVLAEYTFHLDDGSSEAVEIRQRFEIISVAAV